MYTFNFAYVAAGRPAAAREAFCSPDRGGRGRGRRASSRWSGPKRTSCSCSIEFLKPGDIENVKKGQAAYKVPTLSHFLGKLAPAAPPSVE